jgi:hypothetical protein
MRSFSVKQPLILSWLLFSAMTVAGCATTLGTSLIYNHADWLLTRQLDGYLDLSRSQKAFVSTRLDGLLDRHRQEALPRYEQVVSQVQQRVQRGLTSEDLDWALSQYEQLRTDLFARFAKDAADFVRLVEERQIPRLRNALRQRLAKQEKLVREGLDARLSKRTEQILALAKEWLGPMTRRQEQEITRLAMEFPDTLPVTYAHQLRRNEELIAVLESRNRDDNFGKVYDWLVNQERNADAEFLEASGQLKHHIRRLILALDQLATPDQRRHVLAKLDELSKTIQGLSRA